MVYISFDPFSIIKHSSINLDKLNEKEISDTKLYFPLPKCALFFVEKKIKKNSREEKNRLKNEEMKFFTFLVVLRIGVLKERKKTRAYRFFLFKY